MAIIRIPLITLAVILGLKTGLFCVQGQQMPQDYWSPEQLLVEGDFFSLTIGPDGNFYTGSDGGTTVSVFDKNFQFVKKFGTFSGIRGIVVNSLTNVFVVDAAADKIKVFDKDGASIREFGGTGTADGQFRFTNPFWAANTSNYRFSDRCGTMAARDALDRLYVTDTANNRVQVFNSDGEFLGKWNVADDLPGSLTFPRSIIVVPPDRVWVWGASRETSYLFGSNSSVSVSHGSVLNNRADFNALIKTFDLSGIYQGSHSNYIGLGFASNMATSPDGIVAVDSTMTALGISLVDKKLRVLYETTDPRFKTTMVGKFSFSPINLPGTFNVTDIRNPRFKGIVFNAAGDLYFSFHETIPANTFEPYINPLPAGIYVMRRGYSVDGGLSPNGFPLPSVAQVVQRPNTTFIDIDFRIDDLNSATVETRMLAFIDGGNSLNQLIEMTAFEEGTETNLGVGVPTNTDLRVTWNVGTDRPDGFLNLQFEVLAKDERGLLPFHFITVPASGVEPSFTMSHQPITNNDLLSIWYWLIASNDPAINFTNGQVTGAGGSLDGQVLGTGITTTAAGRSFLYQRLNLRSPTSAEITRAQSGRYGFATVSTNSVVKLP
ncbi:MAG: hypothetical protein K9N62_12550 [Verrucomicrobia bacterium]|nr:hypothetical protein [Verrucomicrobiota bacterium]